MSAPFDPGYFAEPFATLCRDHPGAETYPQEDFRLEWGPVFHRGRLDGSARVLVVGQDPAASEEIARRILVGAAGQRAQGLLARLGVRTSYAMVNAFLYSVYGQQGGERHRSDAAIAAYRDRWLDALLTPRVEAVIAFGGLADEAWGGFVRRSGRGGDVAYAHVFHPTWPESSAGADPERLARATRELLEDWNEALEALAPAIRHPDSPTPLRRYAEAWQEGDLVPIPPEDLPPGLPDWMRSVEPWARRSGATRAEKRATIVVTVPAGALPLAVPGARARPSPRVAAGGAASRCALRGRVVAMDGRVVDDGVVWIADRVIEAVEPAGAAVPAGFSGVEPLATGGAIYPGFIDLHNHLAYDVLPLWNVPATYANRDDWKKHPQYDQLVKLPMAVLGKRPEMLPAICRYVECKALFGGVTTTQGIRLVSAAGITRYFRGIVRNVEMPDDPTLARGESRMPDVAASDLAAFWETLRGQDAHGAAYLLHLAEGTDERARKHFLALRLGDGEWAIDRALDGIHCVALRREDFETLAARQGSMVWSPMSNLLLYGKTADVAAAKAAGVRIALGCDWSPSGSKNLLGEMKVAWLLGRELGAFDAEEIVAMVTRVAAEVVRWDARLGTLAPGKLADVTVLTAQDDPYQGAVRATEADVRLVLVGGVARYGHPDLVRALVSPPEEVEEARVASRLRAIHLASSDPLVPAVRFTEAQAILSDALLDLPRLAEGQSTHLTRALELRPLAGGGWRLALDEVEPTGVAMRPEFTVRGRRTAPARPRAAPKPPPAPVPIAIDAPTAVGDAAYWRVLAEQRNLPDLVKAELPPMYGEPRPALRRKPAHPRRGERALATAARAVSKPRGKAAPRAKPGRGKRRRA